MALEGGALPPLQAGWGGGGGGGGRGGTCPWCPLLLPPMNRKSFHLMVGSQTQSLGLLSCSSSRNSHSWPACKIQQFTRVSLSKFSEENLCRSSLLEAVTGVLFPTLDVMMEWSACTTACTPLFPVLQ